MPITARPTPHLNEGLEGGFDASAESAKAPPLPVLFSEDLEKSLEAVQKAGGR